MSSTARPATTHNSPSTTESEGGKSFSGLLSSTSDGPQPGMRKVHSEDFSRRRRLRPLHKTPRADRALSTPPSPSALSSSLPEVPRSLVRTLLAGDTEVLPFDAVRAPGEWALDAAQLRAAVEALLLCLPDGRTRARASGREADAPTAARVPPRRRPRPRRRAAVAHAAGDMRTSARNSPHAILAQLPQFAAQLDATRDSPALDARRCRRTAAVPALPPLPAAHCRRGPSSAATFGCHERQRHLFNGLVGVLCPPAGGSSPVPVVGRRRVDQLPAGARVRALAPCRNTRRRRHAGRNAVGRTRRGAARRGTPSSEASCWRRWSTDGSDIGGGGRVPSSSTLASLDSSTDGGEMRRDETRPRRRKRRRRRRRKRRRRSNGMSTTPRRCRAQPRGVGGIHPPGGRRRPQLPLRCSTCCRCRLLWAPGCWLLSSLPSAATACRCRRRRRGRLRFVAPPLSPVQSHLIAFAEATFVAHRRRPRRDLAAASSTIEGGGRPLPRMSAARLGALPSARAM